MRMEDAAPTGLKLCFGFGSTNMPRRRRYGRAVLLRRPNFNSAIITR
jgi:hypothetical protein